GTATTISEGPTAAGLPVCGGVAAGGLAATGGGETLGGGVCGLDATGRSTRTVSAAAVSGGTEPAQRGDAALPQPLREEAAANARMPGARAPKGASQARMVRACR